MAVFFCLPDFHLVSTAVFCVLAALSPGLSESSRLSASVKVSSTQAWRAGILLGSIETLFLFPGAMMCETQVTADGKTGQTGFLSWGFSLLPHLRCLQESSDLWFIFLRRC